jgi:hypothetical protein
MPVVINEFEVIGEAAAPPANAPQAKAGDKPAHKLEPEKLEQPLARLHELSLRVWVH